MEFLIFGALCVVIYYLRQKDKRDRSRFDDAPKAPPRDEDGPLPK